jgi:hypothetical protein
VTKSWKNKDTFYFREALMELVRRWNEMNDSVTCPISFSDEVYRVHAKEEANINAVTLGEILRIFSGRESASCGWNGGPCGL